MAFIGALIQGSSMLALGWEGSPRRTLPTPNNMDPRWWLSSMLLGVGAAIFITSGAMFPANILLTIAGKRREHGIPEKLVTEINGDSGIPGKKGTLAILLTVMMISILVLAATLIRPAISPQVLCGALASL